MNLDQDVAPWADRDLMPCTSVVEAAEGWMPTEDDTPGIVDLALLIATNILFDMSGRRWAGQLEETVRPILCSCRRDPCACAAVEGWRFSRLPVADDGVSEVLIDGEILAPSAYRVDDGTELVRIDGEAWPSRQNMSHATTQIDSWSVTYIGGSGPPAGGELAAASLACELLRWYLPRDVLGDAVEGCRWPRNATTITRQGVTIAGMGKIGEQFDKGRTGLGEVDLWLSSVGAGRARRQGAVVVPEHVYRGEHRRARRTP